MAISLSFQPSIQDNSNGNPQTHLKKEKPKAIFESPAESISIVNCKESLQNHDFKYFYFGAKELNLIYFLKRYCHAESYLTGLDYSASNTKLYASSCHERLPEFEDSFAFQNGILILSLTKDSYYSLGLNGVKSKTSKDIYRISIDLTLPKFQPGDKLYDRISWCFENSSVASFPVVMTRIELDSHGQFVKCLEMDGFEDFTPYKVIKQTASISSRQMSHIWGPNFSNIPKFTESSLKKKDSPIIDYAYDMIEWVGLLLAQSPRLSIFDQVDPFISSYMIPPSLTFHTSNVYITTLQYGFYVPEFLVSVQKSLLIDPFLFFSKSFRHGLLKCTSEKQNMSHIDAVLSLKTQEELMVHVKIYE